VGLGVKVKVKVKERIALYGEIHDRDYGATGVCRFRIDPLRFLAGWHKRHLNRAFSFVLV